MAENGKPSDLELPLLLPVYSTIYSSVYFWKGTKTGGIGSCYSVPAECKILRGEVDVDKTKPDHE